MQAYDDALRYILETGGRRKNRTGIDTISTFSVRSEYRIDTHFPLATKRKLYPKAVFAELLWMLSGSTSNDDLVKLGANFWTPWADQDHPDNKKFYEQTGFPAGYLGPVYGWQMRHFGATYRDWLSIKDQGWTTKQINDRLDGVDQISWLVNEIKNNPTSRRLLVSLWNPRDMPLMRLPPCHYCFHVDIDDEEDLIIKGAEEPKQGKGKPKEPEPKEVEEVKVAEAPLINMSKGKLKEHANYVAPPLSLLESSVDKPISHARITIFGSSHPF
jgi:thymidylate synthase